VPEIINRETVTNQFLLKIEQMAVLVKPVHRSKRGGRNSLVVLEPYAPHRGGNGMVL